MTKHIFIPSIHSSSQLDSKREKLFLAIKNHPEQGRKQMTRHSLLDLAAQNKAEDMVKSGYFGHTSPEGLSANENIVLAGYQIPDYYSIKGNNGESIYKGNIGEPVDRPATAWYESLGHRVHVYGLNNFYSDQEYIGIGWSESEGSLAYVVFLSMPAQSEEDSV